MPRQPQLGRLGACGMIVPTHKIEIYLANGWRLGDEPGCGTARMFLVASGVNRVPENHKKLASRNVSRGMAKLERCNVRTRTG